MSSLIFNYHNHVFVCHCRNLSMHMICIFFINLTKRDNYVIQIFPAKGISTLQFNTQVFLIFMCSLDMKCFVCGATVLFYFVIYYRFKFLTEVNRRNGKPFI